LPVYLHAKSSASSPEASVPFHVLPQKPVAVIWRLRGCHHTQSVREDLWIKQKQLADCLWC
jgi:hypothetical protein